MNGDKPLDCLVIGGGPAGLTAAIYLAHFHLNILVIDEGKSRAGWIPCTTESGREFVEWKRQRSIDQWKLRRCQRCHSLSQR